jgi:hypothetical protein
MARERPADPVVLPPALDTSGGGQERRRKKKKRDSGMTGDKKRPKYCPNSSKSGNR